MPNITFPKEFIENIASILPSHLSMESFIQICHQPLRRSIRLNPLKSGSMQQLTAALGPLKPIPWCSEGYWFTQEPDFQVGNHIAHLSGQFYIQEASSMLPPIALAHVAQQVGVELDRVLDMASAPGSKTTQLAAIMENHGGLIANEYSASRLKVLAANLLRCGVSNSALTHFDAAIFGAALPNTFDAILLDAPCSGEGAIRKDADAFENWNLKSVHEIAQTQKSLIESAFHALKPGGVLVYSTCTLNRYENQQVCQYLLDTFDGAVKTCPLTHLFSGAERSITAEGYLHVWPQEFDSEGFFIAAFQKIEASEPDASKVKRPGKFPYRHVSREDTAHLTDYLAQLGVELPSHMALYRRDNAFWLFPQNLEPLFGKIRFNRIGIKLAEQFKKNYRLSHDFAVAFPHCFSQNRFELTSEQAREYLQGKDIRGLTGLPNKGDCLLLFNGTPLGLAKVVSNRLKNGLPREIVRDQPVIK